MSNRRTFLQSLGAATIIAPQLVRGSAANSAVRVGLLGCGNRGMTHAGTITKFTTAQMVAFGDLYQDKLDRARQKYPDATLGFVGEHAYQQMAESKDIDAIVIATPAYKHPEHLEAMVAAGKHVYCEKPVAVDAAGAKHVLEIGRKAEGRLSLDVGFQIRSAPPFIELVRRIHEGALGEIVCGAAYYYCPFPTYTPYPNASPEELRIRQWLRDRAYSGDIIVEQNIHAIDICNWVLQSHPVKATGTGSHAGRTGANDDVYSHFDVTYHYPNGVHVSFSSAQFGKGKFDVNERFFGTAGQAQSPYSGTLGIVGDSPWTWTGSETQKDATFSAAGSFEDNLAQADSEKQKGFIDSITSGKFHNQAAAGVETALTAMLGREAGYRNGEMTWDELVK
ncbi:MAG TPA: Gfo/Idh/MocA family oxidoreductase [Bryobacteraceae bacterium]|nr:Gfo/Idh/MocA family oxidoreductase [Bryobacteraceae bacterium]